MEISLLHILFLFLLLLVLNSYLFYPVVIVALSKLKRRIRINGGENGNPEVSILISAFNEEKVIQDRIDNLAALDYDFNKIEVLIGSDNSTDGTNDILQQAAAKYDWLKVFLYEERGGKAGVLNKLISEASNEIILFSDANTVFESDSVKHLCADFQKDDIGGVSGRLVLKKAGVSSSETTEETVYWKLESVLKEAEGRLGILIGASGGIFAIRKTLFHEIPIAKAVTDDLFLSLSVLAEGYKFVYCPQAVASEEVGKSVDEEFRRKVRFAATNFQTLSFFSKLLFSKNILVSYSFWSHKVLRWFVPVMMLFLLTLNIIIYDSSLFINIILYLQLAFYLLALFGFIMYLLKLRISLFSYPFFFIMSNIALLKGLIRFLRKEHSVIWKATSR